jgi:hypothetical protein
MRPSTLKTAVFGLLRRACCLHLQDGECFIFLMMGTASSSEMSLNFSQGARYSNTGGRLPHGCHC